MAIRKLVITYIFLWVGLASGQTLPSDHWAYNSIQKMQILGYFQHLPPGSKPYSRLDIARELVQILDKSGAVKSDASAELNQLQIEFIDEINQIRKSNQSGKNESLSFRAKFIWGTTNSNASQKKISVRFGYEIFSKISMQYGAIIDESLISDSLYQGYEWRGFAGYQDQLSLRFATPNLQVLFGREFVDWGYGHSGNLFISDNSRPFDMIKLSIDTKLFRFESFIAQLDKMYDAERYLSAARLSYYPGYNLGFSVGQSALYGGVDRAIDFTLSNPLSFYSFSQDNDSKYMNGMLYADVFYIFHSRYLLYGEILIDDFQVDNSQKADLEPNEIAFMVGVQGVQVMSTFDFWIEFIQARNRTYNAPEIRPWEKFLHRGLPIAHPQGTDFQYCSGRIESWIRPKMQIYLELDYLRKGEGSITGVFEEPWLDDDITVETGYEEAVPYGTLELTSTAQTGFIWQPSQPVRVKGAIGFKNVLNANHINNLEEYEVIAVISMSAQLNRLAFF